MAIEEESSAVVDGEEVILSSFSDQKDSESPQQEDNNNFAFDSLEAVRKKLLDLTARNPLLNYRHPRASCVRLIDELPDQIFEVLKSGKALTFIPVPEPTEKQLIEAGYLSKDPRGKVTELKEYPSAPEWAKRVGLETQYDLPDMATAKKEQGKHLDSNLQTLLYANQLEARLRSLRGKAETAIEESGSNILFLGLGFLEWFESRESEQARQSPLFTIPVQLEKSKLDPALGVYRYTIKFKDEGIITNITLKQKLENDFDLALPEIDEDATPEEYFSSIQNTILKHEPRWTIRRMATLVTLNFSKQVMYQDLDPENWPGNSPISGHPIVSELFSNVGREGSFSTSFHEEYPIDDVDEIHQLFPLIYDADSSQHSALIDAVNGENVVIEGPPGTGKSQTITNLIAACIANGKRVLFVAEKMAALSVVKDRLDQAGLGDFCLELHSHKTHKLKVLEELKYRLDKQGDFDAPPNFDSEIARLEDLKNKLTSYVNLINTEWKNTGLTTHTIFNRAARYRDKLRVDPDHFAIYGIDGESLTDIRQKELIDQADMLTEIFNQVQKQARDGRIENHYWYGVNNYVLMGYELDHLKERLEEWNAQLQELLDAIGEANKRLGFSLASNLTLEEIRTFSEVLQTLPSLKGAEPLEQVPNLVSRVEEFDDFLKQYSSIHSRFGLLEKILKPAAINSKSSVAELEIAVTGIASLGINKCLALSAIQSDYAKLDEHREVADEVELEFGRIGPNLPEPLGKLFNVSPTGLKEVLTLANLILELPSELWRYRDVLYDSTEIDPLLDRLTDRLRVLTPLHTELEQEYNVHRLPDSKSLRDWQSTLADAGFFAFLSPDWRSARKNIFNLASSRNKPDKKKMLELLPKTIAYQDGIAEIEQLSSEDNLLSSTYRGIDTPIERIKALRSWYKKVRKEYGFGFTERSQTGSQLLTLDSNLARAVSETLEQGLGKKIEELLSFTRHCQTRYSDFTPLQGDAPGLSRESSALMQLSRELEKPLQSISSFVFDAEVSFAEISDSAETLKLLYKSISDWTGSDLTPKLVPAYLDFRVENGTYDEELYRSGLNLSSILHVAKDHGSIISAIRACSSPEHYNQIRKAGSAFLKALDQAKEAAERFVELGDVNYKEWCESSSSGLDALVDKNKSALNNPNWLNTWLDYIRLRSKLCGEGISRAIAGLEGNTIRATELNDVFQLAIHHQLAMEVLKEEPRLSEFNGLEQMAIRKKYREYDKKILDLQRKKIASQAARNKPPVGIATGKAGDYTETSLIKREVGKKRRHIPIRSLLRRSGSAIQALKPCLMMSPMSVAQYLAPGRFNFDIVVMDEASQIRPEDAIGATARGKSLVVVGDPKQLPPTNFFQKIVDEETDEETNALEESESILESVIPIFKTRRLRWHYRSRHESLIAFSNLHFYDSNLILFPSPFQESEEFGIRFALVERGRFQKGRNAEEAREVALAAKTHLMSNPDESIGLVAMNAEQRDEIERQLEQLVKEEPSLRKSYDLNQQSKEPLFIKNLENVQGDERDVIVISMTYGPEQLGGRVLQRFGPINKDTGWRRLNVLFTRSKKRMLVFSSMSAGDILVGPGSKKGVQSLRAFLEFCESGHLHQTQRTGRPADSDFEVSVMAALSEHGYDCEPQLGVAGFFLDLAVIDPGKPGRYLMGIECDGATYHSAKSARDRDRLRQEVLEGLGWRINRIWSTDWFKNPQAQLAPILNELAHLRTKTPESRAEEEPQNLPVSSDSVAKPLIVTREEEVSLKQRLIEFAEHSIETELHDTPEDRRLLRPAMIEALVNHLPTSKEEFSELIPAYLRTGTEPKEAQLYLDEVLMLIADYG